MEKVYEYLIEIERLKAELINVVDDFNSNKYSDCRNLINCIEHNYWLIFRCYVDNNGDRELRDQYHKIFVNINTTRNEMEIKVKALLNKSISLM